MGQMDKILKKAIADTEKKIKVLETKNKLLNGEIMVCDYEKELGLDITEEELLYEESGDPYLDITSYCQSGHFCMDYDGNCDTITLKVRKNEELDEMGLTRIGDMGYNLICYGEYGEYTYYLFSSNTKLHKIRNKIRTQIKDILKEVVWIIDVSFEGADNMSISCTDISAADLLKLEKLGWELQSMDRIDQGLRRYVFKKEGGAINV